MKSLVIIGTMAMTGALALASAQAQIMTPQPAHATDGHPSCSAQPAGGGDCHVHDRQTYMKVFVDKPDPRTQPHAWDEYREYDRLEKMQQNGS